MIEMLIKIVLDKLNVIKFTLKISPNHYTRMSNKFSNYNNSKATK
jgi:hypothetical protein